MSAILFGTHILSDQFEPHACGQINRGIEIPSSFFNGAFTFAIQLQDAVLIISFPRFVLDPQLLLTR